MRPAWSLPRPGSRVRVRVASRRAGSTEARPRRLHRLIRVSTSPTSPRRPASASGTTTAPSARSTCPRRSAPASPFLDFDNDGWQDLFFVNSMNWPGHPGPASLPALYRNNHNGTFTDVTRQAGLAIADVRPRRHGRRLRQRRRRRHLRHLPRAEPPVQQSRRREFADVTARAGVGDPGFSTSAAWFDYDNDGTARSLRRQLRAMDDRHRPDVHARRPDANPIARPSRTRARARRSIATRETARSRT